MTRFEKAVDRAIADENRRFLDDPAAVKAARDEGDHYRLEMEAKGILPPLDPEIPAYADRGPGDPGFCEVCGVGRGHNRGD